MVINRIIFADPITQPDDDKCRGNDNNALDSILSGPHQRITRYGLLLDPICKRCKDETIKQKLTDLKKKTDSLCRWINGRVSLDHLHKGAASIRFIFFLYSSFSPSARFAQCSSFDSNDLSRLIRIDAFVLE